MFRRWPILILLILLALGGCNFAPPPTPTLTITPRVITATFLPPTPTPVYIVVTNTPTASPTPNELAGPTATPIQLFLPTGAAGASATPFATAEDAGALEVAVASNPARVCPTCGGLRLRQSPGPAGIVIDYLDANTALRVTGRTADSGWLQVTTPDGTSGWIAAEYAVLGDAADRYPVTGEVQNSGPAVSYALGPAAAVPLPAGAPPMAQIVTGITGHARQIFLDGQRKGNIFNVFSAVGDSITASASFMTQMSGGRYNLGDYTYYQAAVNWWNSRNGRGHLTLDPPHLAAAPGWSTIDMLDAGKADPSVCAPGETPLHCEYRLVRPSVALIMLGTNDSGGISPDQYAANLRRIVEISIEMGVIPVLSTLPPRLDNPGSNNVIDAYNTIITSTARQYDIPLWNYRLAISSLPNQGMGADGVHPSTPPDDRATIFDAEHLRYGYTMRNLTALHVLDQLWRQVLYDGGMPSAPTGVPGAAPLASGADTAPVPVSPAAPASGGTCPGVLSASLTIGGMGRVTPGLPNKLRSQPSTTAAEIGSIPGGATFAVVGGPTCADGYTWWQVSYNGTVGWTASGSSSEYWIEAAQ